MRRATIWLVIGTRPEAIKLAPVAHALEQRGLCPELILTGQHPDLGPADYGLAGMPARRLDCPGLANPHLHVRSVVAALLPHLEDEPDLLVVQGDTSSALGGALAGFSAGIPVAHVEAGLRTYDPDLPWPEEEYRTAIDAEATLLFAPTDLAAANLMGERVPGEIHVTGNTSIDALVALLPELPPQTVRDGGVPRLLVACHRRESWGEGVRSVARAASRLAERGIARVDLLLHPNRHVADTIREAIMPSPMLRLVEPCGHADLLRRMRDCDLLLSDSGGVQEEAPALGVPLLVLRDKTERPEGLASGNMRLVGTDEERLVAEVERLLADVGARAAMSRPAFPYGDGHAAPVIAAIVDRWLERPAQAPKRMNKGAESN